MHTLHRNKRILLMLLSAHVTSILFLVRFNTFALTTGFYWSYTLLLKSPVPMRSCSQILPEFVLCSNEPCSIKKVNIKITNYNENVKTRASS